MDYLVLKTGPDSGQHPEEMSASSSHRIRELERQAKEQAETLKAMRVALSAERATLPGGQAATNAAAVTNPKGADTREVIGFWQWVLRTSALASPLALIVAIVAWLQPQWSTHAARDLETNIDGRIDAKLVGPARDMNELKIDVTRIETRALTTFSYS